MGDVSSNVGTPWFHTDPVGNVLDVRAGGFHIGVGTPWQAPPPISLADYTLVHAAAWTSQGAFDAQIVATAWGAWYTSILPVADRALWRRMCARVAPVVKIPEIP